MHLILWSKPLSKALIVSWFLLKQIILQIAHHKGYIVVNWSNIFNELEQVAAADENEAIVGDWVANKIRSFKTWTKNNSYIVAGFLCGFMYKTFR